MEYGYCNTTLIPCRAEPSDKAEQTNQLLFGEPYQVVEKQEKWLRIRTLLDHYDCWIDRKLHRGLLQAVAERFPGQQPVILSVPYFPITDMQTGQKVHLTYGSIIPAPVNGTFAIGGDTYRADHNIPGKIPRQDLVTFSHNFINAPYLWGGKSLFGADCSGFVQVVYRICGIWLPRDAHQQADCGSDVDIENVEAGDLAFFGQPEGRITHVGICTGNGTIIHASGRCRVDTLDEKGIYNKESGSYSHNLRSIKRVL
jgi:hypothetical protein